MLLIYSDTTNARLQYICDFVFAEQLGLTFTITIDSEYFMQYSGMKFNYSNQSFEGKAFQIRPVQLLFQDTIENQPIDCFDFNGQKAFYSIEQSDYSFDLLAASFYLLSRYEEYLPHEKDSYGRFSHLQSLAFREQFLQVPLINVWLSHFSTRLKSYFPAFNPRKPIFRLLPTYDIDIAFSYTHKGWIRNVGGFLKKPSLERIKVLLGWQRDPFDSYEWLNNLHKAHQLEPIYFFLVSEKNGAYDKNILPHKTAMWKLVKKHAALYKIGLHPSWQSGDAIGLIKKERIHLEAMAEGSSNFNSLFPIHRSRQHYIRFKLPTGYQNLMEAGITDDYSMGYGSINGFRASVAASFYWYDLAKDQSTSLRIHPFCYMDANAYYEQKQSLKEAEKELQYYLRICQQYHGQLISIWHNNFLGNDKNFKGWKELYQAFIQSLTT
ncbi:MAG: polysaccharide deacetylase family protein [Ferruginibacter sp.]